jgi:hypothetical protein
MRHEADVRGVDSHTECGRSSNDVKGAGKGEGFLEGWYRWGGEAGLDCYSGGRLEAGMVGLACYVGSGQTRGQSIRCKAEWDVYDACDWKEGCRGYAIWLFISEMAKELYSTMTDIS